MKKEREPPRHFLKNSDEKLHRFSLNHDIHEIEPASIMTTRGGIFQIPVYKTGDGEL